MWGFYQMVSKSILDDLYTNAGSQKEADATKYVMKKKVNITKVLYDNENNFEIKARVTGSDNRFYDTYIQAKNGELEDLSCDCQEYKENYGACKHLVATMMEFESNPAYIKIFKKEENKENNYKNEVLKKEKYRAFKQILNEFYKDEQEKEKPKPIGDLKIIPTVIIKEFEKKIKVEFKIGNKQFYKIKNIPEFYDHMMAGENYRYGSKLEFVHTKQAFQTTSLPILEYILKYAEIIKFTNESLNSYTYYGKMLNEADIDVSNTGLDDLFDALKNTIVTVEKGYDTRQVLFTEEPFDVKFCLTMEDDTDYKIVPNLDIYGYQVFEGKQYIYVLKEDKLYRCSKELKETSLKILDIFRKNYTKDVIFGKEDISTFFSVVMPKIKENLTIDERYHEQIEKYMPKELGVKIYLDYDKNNHVTADIKFCYDEIEFNPLVENPTNLPRNIVKENDTLKVFLKTGFMLDKAHARLILADDEKIYEFLSQEIEYYMNKFEVLATDNFKRKEIRQPKIMNFGIRIENNLLNLDFQNIDMDLQEVSQILEKYQLKKKFYRLKDGSFIKLEDNENVAFLDSVISGMNLKYKDLEKTTLSIPIYRSLYLDRLLKNFKNIHVEKDDSFREFIVQVDEKVIDDEIKEPANLKASLREYQKTGYKWLRILEKYQLGGILADDMGLGKTLQMIAVFQAYKEENPNGKTSIVICPSSLLLNWNNEINKFAPDLKIEVIHGTISERKKKIANLDQYDIIVTSYDLLKRDIELYQAKDYEFKYIVADEAQYIKNNNTQNSRAIKEIKAETKYALTGTPIENSLSELWSIFDFIMPDYLFSYKRFKDQFEQPIIKENDETVTNKLKMLIEPFILRRIKKDVLTELPDKTVTVLYNEMQGEQLKIYHSYMASAKQEAMLEIKQNGFEKSQIRILALLMRLRQICCHPSLFIDNYKEGSSKLNQCMEIMNDAIKGGHKILLFSGYTSMFDLLEKELKKQDIKYFKLTGQTKVAERVELVDEFNANPEVKVFLISLKAGGTGLNLIGADMVIHYDPWWNLSAENQATDRTYRIGQKNNVQVYKLITKNSIEEKIFELQQKKAKLIDNMLSTEQTFINKLSKEDIMNLFN